MDTSLVTTNTWRNFILEDPEAIEANRNPNLFLEGTKASSSNDARLRELGQNPRTPIIAIAPVTGKMKLYFGFSNLGGTRTRQQNKMVAFEGIGPSATSLLFPEEGLTNLCNVRSPRVASLTAATDAETFRNLTPENGNRRLTLKQTGYIILPLSWQK